MQRNSKKGISIVLALIMIISVFALPVSASAAYSETVTAFTYNGYEIPAYDGDLYETVNGNTPTFTSSELNQTIEEHYGPIDGLGRVSTCWANIDETLMPTEPRGEIGSVKPTGFKQKNYSFIENGGWLYNRSHLIGWQLTGENANKNNLMTGTRSFNAKGMLPFENAVADYVKQDSDNNVLYRVTPVFIGDNLLASGVIMEAESVDDLGASISFCVFVYNVEKGVSIDYLTGDSIANNAPAPEPEDISSAYVRLTSLYFTYTGKAITPLDYVEYKHNRLALGKDYTVSYVNNINAGTATVIVTGINGYKGTAVKTFSIYYPKPKKPVLKKPKGKKKAITVKWNAVSDISGYEVQYATNKKFKKAQKVTVNSKSAKSKTVKKKVKAKKKYFVRVRAYKTVNGRKFYSDWSNYKTVKTR